MESTYSLLEYTTPAHLPSDLKTSGFEVGGAGRGVSEQEKALQQVHTTVRDTLPLLHDSADPMVLEVSVADRDTVWCLEEYL